MAELDFNCRLTSGFARSLHNWTATNASIDIRTISFKRYISLAYIIGTFYHIGQLNRHNTRQYSSTIPSQPRVFLDPFAGHSTPLSMTVGALDHFTPLNTEHNRESKCYILNDVIYLTLHQLTFTGVVGVNWVSTFLQTVHSKRLRKYDRGRKSSTVPVHFLVRDQLANGAGTGTKFGQLQIHRKESQLCSTRQNITKRNFHQLAFRRIPMKDGFSKLDHTSFKRFLQSRKTDGFIT